LAEFLPKRYDYFKVFYTKRKRGRLVAFFSKCTHFTSLTREIEGGLSEELVLRNELLKFIYELFNDDYSAVGTRITSSGLSIENRF